MIDHDHLTDCTWYEYLLYPSRLLTWINHNGITITKYIQIYIFSMLNLYVCYSAAMVHATYPPWKAMAATSAHPPVPWPSRSRRQVTWDPCREPVQRRASPGWVNVSPQIVRSFQMFQSQSVGKLEGFRLGIVSRLGFLKSTKPKQIYIYI